MALIWNLIRRQSGMIRVEVVMERVPQPIETTPVDSEVGVDEKKGIAETASGSNPTQSPKARLDIGIKQLINKLNLLNFQGLNLSIVFRHRTYKRTKTLLARPTPCKNDRLDLHLDIFR